MQRSTERILTTHVGSLPRPTPVLDALRSRSEGRGPDDAAFDRLVSQAVTECVATQAQHGVDVVSDGEQGKVGFFAYARERLEGFEPVAGGALGAQFAAEVDAFPEYYAQYFARAMTGGSAVRAARLVCTGPVRYRGQAALQRDLANLRAGVAEAGVQEAFMPSVAPTGVGANQYYASQEAYLAAVADAMRTEYQAIVDAGFLLQVDDPWLAELYSYSGLSGAELARAAALHVEAANQALRGIPPERVRYHTCYGINEGPRIFEASVGDMADVLFQINAGAYSFEAANPRHEHEYHVWDEVKLPEGKVLIPGVVNHYSNVVEHPRLIAERLVRFAERVGRENVLAGSDCGFSSQATYQPEVHPTVVWAKFDAMAEGARLASRQLWGT